MRSELKDLSDRLYDLPPDASDGLIALRLADHLTDTPGRGGKYRVFAAFKSRSEAKEVAESFPHTELYKNVVGFTTADREHARGWIIQAALAGYQVFRSFAPRSGGGGNGTLFQIRNEAAGRARDMRFINGETEFG